MDSPLQWGAVIVAAGRGTRFGRPKQLVEIAGQPLVAWCLRTFAAMDEVLAIVVATEAAWIEEVTTAARAAAGAKLHAVVPGGATRQASTYNALQAAPKECQGLFVHDGARPMIVSGDVRAGMQPVRAGHASLLAVPVVDTIKIVDSTAGLVRRTLERSALWAAQTPQFAMRDEMLAAHEAAVRDGVDATDDAMLLERIGVEVHVVPAGAENFKVTLPEDLARAEAMLRARMSRPLEQC